MIYDSLFFYYTTFPSNATSCCARECDFVRRKFGKVLKAVSFVSKCCLCKKSSAGNVPQVQRLLDIQASFVLETFSLNFP